MPQIYKENLIDKLDEIGMLYFVIGSLFSAETLVDVESCEASLKGVEMLRAELPTSKYKDDPKIKKFLDEALTTFGYTHISTSDIRLFYLIC
jgi:hypothetical protein